jgi:hypothetical protein
MQVSSIGEILGLPYMGGRSRYDIVALLEAGFCFDEDGGGLTGDFEDE